MEKLLKVIEETIKSYFTSHLYENSLMTAKLVAISFILIEFIHRQIKHLDDKSFSGFKFEDFTKPTFYILLICFFTSILKSFELITQEFFQSLENSKPMYQTLIKAQKETNESPSSKNISSVFLPSLDEWREIISEILMKLVCWVIGVLDILIYAWFIAERYFLMGLANLLFPFLLAFSALNKFQDYILKGLKAYLAILVSIYVIGLGMNLGQKLFENLQTMLSGDENLIGHLPSVILASIIALLLKFKIIKTGITHLYRVLT